MKHVGVTVVSIWSVAFAEQTQQNLLAWRGTDTNKQGMYCVSL